MMRYFPVTDNSLHTEQAFTHRSSLISALVTGELTPAPIWKKRNYRLKFLLRTLLFYTPTRRMLRSLSQRPNFGQLLKAQVTLPSKPHRQYLTLGMNACQRADAVVSHYEFIDTLTGSRLSQALMSADETPLIVLEGKDASHFTLSASCASKAEREGETTLWLHDASRTLLASVTFSVVNNHGEWQLVIGGLQGPRRNVSHEVIKQATRACHGIFPKRLLMEFIWLFASHSGISTVYGVSDNGHVFRALRYRLSKGRHFHASYDEFWASVEGVKENRWRWRLPCEMARKPLESIASKKRAEYRRRFQLLDSLADQVAALTK
ncbi:VirK/YbjX family protein [Trabulsiella odontotermitis]|uniref:VirK/YbjX family protein n=1 Tax=Trabulsiella odontotermitis TaxID=379893 RepID=UPI003AC972B5